VRPCAAVWKDGAGKWNVFEDKCPHRLAPLSEGRIEDDGTLLCAYHAWRFDGSGACTDMPQASSPEEEARVKANPRSCANSRPSMEAQGLVWAWGEGGKEAELEARMTPPLLVPEIEGVGKSGEAPGGAFRNHWQVRDMPYGWAAFFENAIDPAHAVVSHHTLVGDRYDDPAGFKCVVERPMTNEAGFRAALDPAVPPFNTIGKYDAETSYDFQPPCLLKIDWRHEEARFLTSHYCVPTRPGWCRHFVVTVCQRGEGVKDGKLSEKVRQHRWFKLNLFTLTSPAWLTHVLGPTFLHQDMVLLHQQEKIIAQGDGQALADKWKSQVFIPTGRAATHSRGVSD
jgi:phenylpropionate dioxygenase-like ring-hydroxylating dioxygenase large terminal subunit